MSLLLSLLVLVLQQIFCCKLIMIMIMISKFLFNLYVIIFFWTKLLILSILFSTTVNTAFVAKPLIIVILFSISVILAL